MGEPSFGNLGRLFVFFFLLTDVLLLMYLFTDKGWEYSSLTLYAFFFSLACFFITLTLFILIKTGKLYRFNKFK